MSPEIERLLEGLQTGWQPKPDEIDTRIPQLTLWDWQFALSFTRPEAVVIGYDADRRVTRSDQIVWIDADLRWALSEDGFWWLHEGPSGAPARIELYSILVTTTGRPAIGSRHVLRHAERFWSARVASATPGPPASMAAWAVTWDVDDTVRAEEALAMARNVFALDARATPEEAARWHEIDEEHWREHGYAPNHWT
jgi:hypothetical protein